MFFEAIAAADFCGYAGRQLGEAMRTMDGAALAVEKIEDYLRTPR